MVHSFNKSGILDAPDIQYLGLIADGNSDITECALWKIFEQFDVDIGENQSQSIHAPYVLGVKMDQFKIYANQSEETYTWNIQKMFLTLQRVCFVFYHRISSG